MFGIIGYVALIGYAGGLFTWAVSRGRDGTAIGILLAISGLQLAVMETLNPGVGWAIAASGVFVASRDVVKAIRHGARLVPALARASIEHADEVA